MIKKSNHNQIFIFYVCIFFIYEGITFLNTSFFIMKLYSSCIVKFSNHGDELFHHSWKVPKFQFQHNKCSPCNEKEQSTSFLKVVFMEEPLLASWDVQMVCPILYQFHNHASMNDFRPLKINDLIVNCYKLIHVKVYLHELLKEVYCEISSCFHYLTP